MENTNSLQATIRTETGKGACRRMRAAGKIPAVVYGPNFEALSLSVDPEALAERLLGDYGRNALFRLEIEGHDAAPPVVRVTTYDRDPVRRTIKHVDFEVIDEDKTLKIKVPLKLEGKPVGVTRGGVLRQIRYDVMILTKPANVPKALVADISKLRIGHMHRISEVAPPENVKVLFDDNFSIATVFVPRGVTASEEEEGGGEA